MDNVHTQTIATAANILQPMGAYVSLEQLQRLRHAVKQALNSRMRSSRALLSGQHSSRALSRGMEFDEVREYQPGDDVRTIDWRVTARTQVAHTKRYIEEKENPVITVVDQRASLFFGSDPCFKSVYACYLAALINWSTLKQGDRSGGVVFDNSSITETRAVRSHKSINQWLQQLTRTNQALHSQIDSNRYQQQPPLTEILEFLVRTAHTGAVVYLISDFYGLDKSCEQLLFQLSRHNQVHCLWVVDQLEMRLPTQAVLSITNGQSKSTISNQKKLQENFHRAFLDKQQHLKNICQNHNIAFQQTQVQTLPSDYLFGPTVQRHNS